VVLKPANPDYRSPELKALDWAALQDKPVPERKWIVPGWIPHGQTTMLAGDGGIGKTLAAMSLATSCATRQPWFGQVAMSCRVLVLMCEDGDDEIERRHDAINRYFGLDFRDLENLKTIPRIGHDNTLMAFDVPDPERRTRSNEPTEFFQQVHDAAQNFGAQLIVLDSLHDFFAGNENSRVHARQFIQLLTSLARDCDGAVLLTAHPSLDGLRTGSGTAGSTAWNNAVRSRLYLTHEDGDETGDRRVLHRKKANYASRRDIIRLTWRDGVFVADEASSGVRGTSRGRKAETIFLELLAKVTDEGRHVSQNNKASNYAPRLFADRPEREGFTKQDFRRAMEGLFAQGRIRNEIYGDRPSRQFEHIAIVLTDREN
jgi:RecA-family ATPase